MEQYEGTLYEIHITVAGDDALKLMDYIHYRKEEKHKYILEWLPVGDNNIQPMISKYRHGTYQQLFDYMMSIKQDMISYGLTVVRSKLETGISASIVPATQQDYDKLVSNIITNNTSNNSVCLPYAEFHVKVLDTTMSTLQIHNLCQQTLYNVNNNTNNDIKIGVSINVAGTTKVPTVTMRIYNSYYDIITVTKNRILSYLSSLGLKLAEEVRQEYSVFDDNQSLDNNWV